MSIRRNCSTLMLKKHILTVCLVALAFTVGYKFRQFNPQSVLKYFQSFARSNALLDITDFHFQVNPRHICSMGFKDATHTILTVVHSARENFLHRKIIRRTFGSVKEFKGWAVQTVFILGLPATKEEQKVQSDLDKEIREYKDIVVGNFLDNYRNLTYKHLTGLRWAIDHCPEAQFYLKTDDDVVVEIFHAIEKTGNLGSNFYCSMSKTQPVRNNDNKWYVSYQEYASDTYPPFCNRAVYLTGIETIKKIYSVSSVEDFLWLEDVEVTGILREKANKNAIGGSGKIINITNAYTPMITVINYRIDELADEGYLAMIRDTDHKNGSCIIWNSILKSHKLTRTFVSTCSLLF